MGWELHLVASHTLNEALFRFLIPCRIWNSPMSCAGSAGLTRIIAGLAIPVHPTVCGKWTSPNTLGSSSLPTLGILNYIHYGQSSSWPHCHFVDEISPFICAWFSSNHDLPTPWPICAIFFYHHWALRSWLESMGPSCLAYAYFSIVEFSSHMLYNPPRRTLFTSGAIQALSLCRGFPYCISWLFNPCKGFLLLHVINSFLETSCLLHRSFNCASSRASSGHFL